LSRCGFVPKGGIGKLPGLIAAFIAIAVVFAVAELRR
jgi:hypothetical protein